MAGVLTLERLIAFLKVDLALAFCWPLPPTATRFQITRNKLLQWLCGIHGTLGAISTAYTIWVNHDDLYIVMKLSSVTVAIGHVPIQIILYAFEHDRLQMIIHEMESFVELAKLEEKVMFQYYINKCKFCYGTVMGCITFTLVAMLFGPLLLDQTFPLEIEYPFDVERQPLKTIIYLHHVVLIYQSYIQVCTNVFVALLLWFLVARFDILACKFREIANASEFAICVKQHQHLLRYAKNVIISLRFVTLAAIIATTVAVILASLTFLSKQPVTVKVQFMTLAFSALMEVFLCAWPADCLIHMSSNISQAAYDSMWFDRKVSLHKDLLYITARSQQPVILNIPCVLPILSLNFYSSFLSSTFSFLTAFRAVLETEDES